MEKIVKNGMRTTGRFALDGSECKVTFSAPYRCFEVKNEGTADIVVSIEKGKAATDSGVIIVAPQTSATLAHMRPNVSTVYITGEGNIQVVGKNEVEAVFKSGGAGGGDVTINGVSQTYVDSRDSAVLKAAKDYADEAAEKINAKNAIACDNKPTYADGVITYTKNGVAYSTDDTDTWFYYNDGEELKQTIFVDGEEFTITSAGKVDFTEFVSSSDVTNTYTGNEGDTSKIPDIAALRMLDSKITGNISNPNLLINPDFGINQRSFVESEIGSQTYTVDRWCSTNISRQKISFNNNKVTVQHVDTTGYATFGQAFDKMFAGQYTISVNIDSVNDTIEAIIFGVIRIDDSLAFSSDFIYQSVIVTDINNHVGERITRTFNVPNDAENIFVYFYSYVVNNSDIKDAKFTISKPKLEIGSIATPFIPPDPATELVKCQRYYQIHTSGDFNPVDLRPNMRIVPTITQLSDGNYAYDAEIY